MSVLSSYLDGARRVLRAPTIWLGAWSLTLLLGVPLALVLRGMLAHHLDASLAANAGAAGVNWDWWQEFQQQATGLGTTFGPSVLGFASVLRHLSDVLDNAALAPVLAGVVAAWLVAWSFLSGGILDRYARNRPTWASGFFAACGTHFFRFLRLGIVAYAVYYVLFAWVHPLLFETAWPRLTRDLAVERTAFAAAVALYTIFGLLLAGTTLVFDYARIRIVVEDRRSALGAILAGGRFVRRHPGKTVALFAVAAVVFLLMAGVYALVAPRGAGGGAALWLAVGIGQTWIVVRVFLKLAYYGATISLFQRQLAHADYVATAIPEWPESPSAEALRGETPGSAVP